MKVHPCARKATAILMLAVAMCAHAAGARAQNAVRLRSRSFVPQANVSVSDPGTLTADARAMPARPAQRRHLLLQFAGPIRQASLTALRGAGGIPLRFVPENTLSVAVPEDFNPARVPDVRWVGELEPGDRLSRQTQLDIDAAVPAHPLTVVEFHADVERVAIEATLAQVGQRALPARGLPVYAALIATDAGAVRQLAALDDVAWIFPGAPEIETGDVAGWCDGVARTEGIVASFAAAGQGWDGPGLGSARLGYVLTRPSTDLSRAPQLREVERAMSEWSRYVDVTWRPVTNPSAVGTVALSWQPAEHGDGFPFTPDILAHAFYPSPEVPESIAGDVHFNDTHLWSIGVTGRWDVFSVALHELGHSLGLMHSDDPDAVMYPTYRGIVVGLSGDDVLGIRSLYRSSAVDTLPAGWRTAVVGTDDSGGVTSSGDTVIVAGGGRDIWDRADNFRFVWQGLRGDGDIVARVDSLSGVHRWSKAGVMFRAAAAPDAAQGIVLVSESRGVAFQRRTQTGGTTVSDTQPVGATPQWLWLSRRGMRLEGYVADDGGAWRLVGWDDVELPRDALVGLAVSSHLEGRAATATFSRITVTSARTRWLSADIGDVGVAGSWSASGSSLVVRGAGADVWDRSDAFQFVWQSVDGDVDVTARLASLSAVRAWTKAGVMIRGGLDPAAPHAFVLGSAGKGVAFQRRPAAGGLTAHTDGGGGTAPAWLRLSRRGDRITAYRSSNGRDWITVGSDIVPMRDLVFVGLAVSSHSAARTATASFDNITIVPR